MSRKDTIIIAVLINAGLLIVLFATALKPSDSKEEEFVTPLAPVAAVSEASPLGAPQQTPQDEVDQVLRQFSQPQTSALNPPASSFADDLNAPPALPSMETSLSAPITAALIETPQEQFVEVKVKKGDVLEKIARQNRTTVSEIMKVNHLASTNLKIGQVLRIPNKTGARATAASTEGEVKYYTIKNGDNPWTIAVKNHMKLEELLKLNNLDSEKARRLKPGDQLRIK